MSTALGTDWGIMLARSNFRNQVLPTTVRLEVLPTSTSIRNTRETRKQKEVKREKKRRVRVASLITGFERAWRGDDFWRRARELLGRAMVVEWRAQTDYACQSMGHSMKATSALPMALSWWGETEGALKEERKTKKMTVGGRQGDVMLLPSPSIMFAY